MHAQVATPSEHKHIFFKLTHLSLFKIV